MTGTLVIEAVSAEKTLRVEKSTVYALSMPKVIYVQLQGVANEIRVIADKVEPAGGEIELRKGDTTVAVFQRDKVLGWWIKDEAVAVI